MRDRVERLYLLTGAAQGFMEAWALAAIVWWVIELELSPLQLVLLGTALEGVVFVAEVPTGVVADIYSRKWAIVAGYAVMGTAQALAPVSPRFGLLLVWQALWSVGWTLQSGADTAWVTDELDRPVDTLIVRHAVWRSVGIVVGLVATAALGAWSLRGAMAIIGAVSVVVAAALAVTMPETGFTRDRAPGDGRWRQAARTWVDGARAVRTSHVLRVVVISMVLVGMADEAIDRLDVLRLTEIGLPDADGREAVLFFGAVWTVMTLLNIPVMLWAENRLDGLGDAASSRSLATLLAVSALGIVALALGPWLGLALAGWTVRDIGREVLEPISVAATNRHSPSAVRATVISFRGQAVSLGQIAGGLALGTVAELTTVSVALSFAAVLLAAAAVPYLSRRALRDTPG